MRNNNNHNINWPPYAYIYAFAAGLEALLERNGAKTSYVKDRGYYECEFQYSKLQHPQKTNVKIAATALAEKLLELEPAYANADSGETITFIFDPKNYPAIDLLVRSDKGWEIGFTVDATFKTGRIRIGLGEGLDFGERWFGSPVSEEYLSRLEEIMLPLKDAEGKPWEKLYPTREEKFEKLYRPVTECFLAELYRKLRTVHGAPKMLIERYFGNHDYYKIGFAPKENMIRLQAYNPYGTLNTNPCPDMYFPSRVIDASRVENWDGTLSDNMIRIVFDEGWIVKLRLHHSTKKIVTHLTVDVTLNDSTPYGVYKTVATW